MIKTTFLFIGIIAALPAFAQEANPTTPAIPERKNELGIFSNSPINSNSFNTMMTAGIQYKHWVTPGKAYRSLVAYGRYSIYEDHPSTKLPSNDTTFSVFSSTKVDMAFLGAGVEMQRHFYKRVYLFAALELRAGTGQGRGTTVQAAKYYEPGKPYLTTANTTTLSSDNVSMTHISVVPSIGGKIQFNRISFGTELTPIDLGYRSVNKNGLRNSLFDMNLGEFSGRFFINFRF